MDKAQLRTQAILLRKALTPGQRKTFSENIITTLHDLLAAQHPVAGNLLIYRSLPSEVATESLLGFEHYRLFAPVTHHHEHMEWHQVTASSQWQPGLFGIMEPTGGVLWRGGREITTLLCPLTAFDRSGNRLGMGKGCFDFWLAQHRPHIRHVIGLAFSCQEVAQVPAEGHDMPMDYIITEKEVVRCQKT